jgi:hypothetical protein
MIGAMAEKRRYLGREGLLPGFVAGYSRIHHDEQRHIGYGTWFLREAVGRDPGLAEHVRRTLRELLPVVAEALTRPIARAPTGSRSEPAPTRYAPSPSTGSAGG